LIGHETDEYRLLSVALAVRDFLALFEHVFFGLVVGNICRRRGLFAILGVMVGWDQSSPGGRRSDDMPRPGGS
jgi:hypothetical protein